MKIPMKGFECLIWEHKYVLTSAGDVKDAKRSYRSRVRAKERDALHRIKREFNEGGDVDQAYDDLVLEVGN